VNLDNPKRVCSGLDNTCNLISGSIELILTFTNEITNKIETFYFNPRVLQNSPIDIIIGHWTIKNKNLAWKIPRGFFLDSFIKRNKNLFLTSQEPVDLDISYQVKPKLSKRLKITEISEKPCTDHICGCQPISGSPPNDVTRTRAHKNKVKVAVNRLSDIPSSTFVGSGPCGTPEIIPIITEPRVGTVLSEEGNTSLTDTRGHTLTTVAQTHTVLRHHTELQPYKLDDGIILGCLFSSLSVSTLSETPNLYNTVFALTDSHTTSLKTEISNNFIDNDGISDYHDSFKPWMPDPQPTTDLLDSIHIEGDEELQAGIKSLCEEYKDIFSNTLPSIPSKMEPFDIKVDTVAWKNPKNRMPHRRQSPKKEMEILRQVTLLEEQGIIKRSNAQYYSQVILAPKPNDEWRLCVDFRNLNNASLENGTHPLANIKNMLNRIGDHKSKYFGKIDLTQGYHQCSVTLATMVLTAFIVFCGIFEFTRLPFGPKKAPAHFQEQMAACVLLGLIYFICEVYLDDIIVHGKTSAEFLFRLREVFKRLRKFKLTVKPSKCSFGMPKVEYCGREISELGLSMSEKKCQTINNFPEPKLAQGLKSFLGMVNYFRDFVQNHSDIVRPLQNLIPEYKRSNIIIWTEEARLAFSAIKNMINDCPTMYFLENNADIYICTDASDYGIGGYCYQIIENKERPVAFMSKSLTSTQLLWPIIQKEAYSIFVSCKDFDYLIRDRKFIIFTDHRNLQFIKEDSNPMVVRWYMSIMELDFTQKDILGKNNPVADNNSRLCPNLMLEQPDLYTTEDIICASLFKFTIDDSEYKMISAVHNSLVGHSGVERTIKRILSTSGSKKFEYLRQKVKRFIRECPLCQKMSHLKIPIIAHPFSASTYSPMECLNMDFVGPFPNKGYILCIVDTFSRWIELFCTLDATALSTAKCLLQHFGRFGTPAQLRSDRGPHFIADVIKEFTELVGTQQNLTLAYSKEENAIVERQNKEINRHIRAMAFDKSTVDDWELSVPIIQRIINSSVNSNIKCSPAELLFGNALNLDRGLFLTPLERNASDLTKPLSVSAAKMLLLQDNILLAAKRSLQVSDSIRIASYMDNQSKTEYATDSYVLVKHRTGQPPTRLHTLWKGPLRVISTNKSHILLWDIVNNKEKTYHVTDLKQFYFDPLKTDPVDVARRDYLEFFVEEILEHKGNLRKLKSLSFLVRWRGFSPEFDKWEPWDGLRDTEQLHHYLINANLARLIPKQFRNNYL
jgi:hypothetical protein